MEQPTTMTGNALVFDVATYYSFQDRVVKALPKEAQIMMLEFGLAVTMDSVGNVQTWMSEGIPGSIRETGIAALWERLCVAEILVGYKILSFDLPLLYFEVTLATEHRTGWPPSTIVDFFDAIRRATGREYTLQEIAQATLGRGKSATLQQTAEWLRRGETQRVAESCTLDVALTRDLYLHTLSGQPLILPPRISRDEMEGFLIWIDRQGKWTRLEPAYEQGRAIGV